MKIPRQYYFDRWSQGKRIFKILTEKSILKSLNGFLKVKQIHCNKENAAGITANERLYEHNLSACCGDNNWLQHLVLVVLVWWWRQRWVFWVGGGGEGAVKVSSATTILSNKISHLKCQSYLRITPAPAQPIWPALPMEEAAHRGPPLSV